MKFKTETGSIYEIDMWAKKFRRVSGVSYPTIYQGADGEWKVYQASSIPVVGHSTFVVWNDSQSTVTSRVTEITEETDGDRSFFKSIAAGLDNIKSFC